MNNGPQNYEFKTMLADLSLVEQAAALRIIAQRRRQPRTWSAAITDSIYIIGGWLDPINHRRGRVWWVFALALYALASNVIHTIDRPGSKSAPRIDPFSHDEIDALMAACEHTARWSTKNTTSERHTASRDRLILKVLLDTGLRAQELCDVQLRHLSLAQRSIVVPHGKGDKSRTVHFGNRTAKLMWEYLDQLISVSKPTDYLFTVDQDPQHPLNRDALRRLVGRLGERAGVAHVHPHRFRHTFATEYLRNGGQMLALKDLLGHSDFEMVEHYAHFVQADVQRDHQSASPVDNWKL